MVTVTIFRCNISGMRPDRLADEYFGYMARQYPVMCMSDEFYFFPRAEEAVNNLDRLDCLDRDKIGQDISYIKGLLKKLDNGINAGLLRQSMRGFLIYFDEIKIWQVDPTLYLKILLFGVNPALSAKKHYFAGRKGWVPRLLKEAMANLRDIPEVYLETALEMIKPMINFLKRDRDVVNSLQEYKYFLRKKTPRDRYIKDIRPILRDFYSYNRGLDEIFEIAACEYEETLKEMAPHGRKKPAPKDLLGLYSREIDRLKSFFKERDIITIPSSQKILVRETPGYMQPIRASASYSCPIKKGPAYFYVTIKEGLHDEYIFLTAHETYPGHHLLDTVRRRLKNPIHRQIESPLFYEGWSSYAESLVSEFGYIKDPAQRMAGLRRRAWRAVRAMLDSGVRINRFKISDAVEKLKGLGYSARIVRSMVRHYILTPGYQLCYTIGKYEIERLRKRFAPRLGLKRFHDLLVSGGEIPFHLIEERLCRIS